MNAGLSTWRRMAWQRRLTFEQFFYFLLNSVLIVSKSSQRAKKTSGIARLEGAIQFPGFHSVRQRVSERRPLSFRKDFYRQGIRDASSDQLCAQHRRASIFSFGNVIFSESPIV